MYSWSLDLGWWSHSSPVGSLVPRGAHEENSYSWACRHGPCPAVQLFLPTKSLLDVCHCDVHWTLYREISVLDFQVYYPLYITAMWCLFPVLFSPSWVTLCVITLPQWVHCSWFGGEQPVYLSGLYLFSLAAKAWSQWQFPGSQVWASVCILGVFLFWMQVSGNLTIGWLLPVLP